MAIEFRCTQCNKLLRTGDDTAGKQAKCPECGAILPVPMPTAGASFVPPPPPPGGDAGSPFAPGGPAPADAENPYQAPSQYGQAPQQPYGEPVELIANRVAGPAIALIVTGALGLAAQVIALPFNMLQLGAGAAARPPIDIPIIFNPAYAIASNLVGFVIGIVVIVGAMKMKNLENYGFAMAASIIAMVPCISPCCLLGLPFGIWALVVLSDQQVKAAFRS